jgi:hypothetical protein
MENDMYLTLILLSFATAAISMTISKAKVTTPFRDWIKTKSVWIGKMLNCPYCVSHWVALGMVLYTPMPINPVISIFAIIALATVIEGLMFRLIFIQEAEIDDLREDLEKAQVVIRELVDSVEE